MIIFLYGPDTYRSKEKIEKIKKEFHHPPMFLGGSSFVLDAQDLTRENLHQFFLTRGLLSPQKLIIVKNLIKKASDDVLEEFLLIAERIIKNDQIKIVLWEGELSSLKGRKKKLFDLLTNKSESYYFPLLSFRETLFWIKEEVKKKEGKIEEKAAKKLIFYRGNNLWELNNEINKLIAYRAGELIREKDIELLVEIKLDENIFHLVDALAIGDREKALKLLNFQLRKSQSWPFIISGLVNHFRSLIITQEILRSKGYVNAQFLSEELKVYPFVAKKILIQARKYTLDELKKIYQALLKIDFRLKTEKITPELLFNLFILGVKKK